MVMQKTDTKVSILTVTLLNKKSGLRFSVAHGYKHFRSFKIILSPDETNNELFGHDDHRYI